MQARRWLVGLWIAAGAVSAQAATPPAAPSSRAVQRSDIPAALGEALCAGELGAKPLKLWSLGVHDAQIEGRVLSRPGGRPLSARELEHKARALAVLRGAGGFAYGSCQGGKSWALALPAPEPLTLSKGKATIPEAALARACESYRVDFAASAKGAPRTLPISAGHVSTAGLGNGVLSVTCQPKAPRWRGPVLWYLAPVGAGPKTDAPFAEALQEGAPGAGPTPALTAWINRVRASEGLPALAVSSELQAQADVLAVDGGLSHDRLLLKHARERLADEARPTKLLGEDRVKGVDAASMAWLLWNSPRHRSLLLRNDANAIGLGQSQAGDERLVVVVVGAEEALKTATTSKPAAKPKEQRRQ